MIDIAAMNRYIEESGMKQGWVAARAGMTQDAMTRTMNGKRRMKADEYVSICRAIGVPLDRFVSEDPGRSA